MAYGHDTPLPEGGDEIRTPDRLVERFLREYTEPGAAVIDPFAGYGTTLAVAQRLDRRPFGLEAAPERVEHARRLARTARVEQGDARELDPAAFPTCDCCFTSPPFMAATDDRDPFEGYTGEGSYETYLSDVATVFRRLADVLATDGRVVVEIANLKHDGRVTPLAWDVADRVAETFRFDGEVVVTWTGDGSPETPGRYGYGYDHSYCLVFTAT